MFLKSFFSRFLFTLSIRNRLLIYFMFLMFVPTLIISTTIYNKSTSIITNKINSSLEEKLNMINENILQKFESINNTFNEICLNRDIIRILSSSHPYDQTEIINEMSVMSKLLNNYWTTQPLFMPRLYIFNRPEYLLYSFSDNVSDMSIIEKEKWYISLKPNSAYTVAGLHQATVSSQTIHTIKIAKRIFALDDMHIQFGGVLTIDVGVDYFNYILSSSKPTIGSLSFIIDDNGSIILSPDAGLLGKNISKEGYITSILNSGAIPFGSFINKSSQGDMLISYKRMEDLNWTIVSLTPIRELNKELISFNRIIFFVIAVCGILALFMALLLSDNISYPIRKLVNSMSEVQNGNFDINLEYKRNDEFAYLINSYKKMVHDIKNLIDKLYISEVKKKEAELKSLQAQINPHFLYNTLDSINWMALELNATNISTMVTSLSNFFRYSLSKGKNIITLGDEKIQVESYLKIQKIRFQEKLDYVIDFQEDILDYLTVKLILQPLVENSIIHGINKMRGKGIIHITAVKHDSNIEIKIRDNGIGANADDINAMLEEESHSTSFGIKNVNSRIKHYFGNEFGIKFFNNEDSGITAVISFPAVKTMEGISC